MTDERTPQKRDDDVAPGPEPVEESELTDEDLEGVAGGDFSFTRPVDKPSPILF